MAPSSSSIRILAVPLAIALFSPAAPAGPYTFTPVALSGDAFDPFGFGDPVLNNAGSVAFNATTADPDFQDGIFRSDVGSLAPIAVEDGFRRFGDPTINGSGQVGFEASLRTPRGEGIFRGVGGSTTPIAGTRDAGDFDFVNAGPSINGSGTVAFIGETEDSFIAGVYAGDGTAPAAPIYDETGAFDGFIGNPSLNDSGAVAFNATLDSGVSGLFVGSGGDFTTVADDTGIFVAAFAFSDPSLNDLGDVAFRAGTNIDDPDDNSGATGHGIFLFRNGVLTTVLQGDFGQFADLGDPSLNNLGDVAFLVSPDFGEEILVTGPGLEDDRVIGTGDLLLGRTIVDLSFSREGLNDRGQLAFTAFFDDGTSGVFLATPAAVPEPSTLALAGVGALGLVGYCRGRR